MVLTVAGVVTVFSYQLPGVLSDTGLLVQDLHEFVDLVLAERHVGHGGQQLAVCQRPGRVSRVAHLKKTQPVLEPIRYGVPEVDPDINI